MAPAAESAVPGYEHLPGTHCGSTALRNLLAFHGLELSEEMAFGLGAGPCFYYLVLEEGSPTRFTNGRTARLEERFLELTGLPLRLDTFEDRESSWAAARTAIGEGRPILLLTDLFYLEHYGRSAHFPGHAVVLVGYDEEVAYLSDTDFEELQVTSLDSLAQARHEPHPFYRLAGDAIHLPDPVELPDPRGAAPAAIEAAARRMIEAPLGESEGLPALRRFAEEIGSWPRVAADWQWCARFNYQAIERRGTGGGNFRLLYSRFLAEAGFAEESIMAAGAAAVWTELAGALHRASEDDKPDRGAWRGIAAAAERALGAEEELWSALASAA